MNYRTERYPVVTLSIIGLNTLIWLITLICNIVTQGDANEWIQEHLWLVPAQSHVWMYLTHIFVHAGFFHLLGNMIFLFLFGSCVEDMIGRLRFALFYLACGLTAAFVFIAMTPEHFASEIPMGGASGAISGCMGMYLLLRAGAKIKFVYFFWLFYSRAGAFEIPAWIAIIFYFLKDLVFAVLGMLQSHSGGGTAFGAHVGGFLGGLTLMVIYKWKFAPRNPAEAAGPDFILDPAKVRAAAALHHRTTTATSEVPTIFLHDGAAQTGPFTLSQVQDLLHHGDLSHEAVYWSEGMEQWQSVKDLSETPM